MRRGETPKLANLARIDLSQVRRATTKVQKFGDLCAQYLSLIDKGVKQGGQLGD